MSFERNKAINHFADATGLDPLQITKAYESRPGLLEERSDTRSAVVSLGAIGLIGTSVSTISVVGDALRASYTQQIEDLPTESVGVLLVSALALAVSMKALKDNTKDVEEDVKKYAPDFSPSI